MNTSRVRVAVSLDGAPLRTAATPERPSPADLISIAVGLAILGAAVVAGFAAEIQGMPNLVPSPAAIQLAPASGDLSAYRAPSPGNPGIR